MIPDEVIRSFMEYDEATKDEKWAAEKCRILMMNAIQIMSKDDYDHDENILFGQFPEINLDRVFSHPTMKQYKNKLSKSSSIYIFESVRMALIDDRTQSDLRCFVNSLDPEKEAKKKSDKELLKNRKGIEGLMNDITANNGMPPTQIKGKDFNGNVDDFDESGGDDLDNDSIDTFFDTKWGLQQEIYLQKPLNAAFRVNQFTRNYDKYINDILIKLHNFSQVYIDDSTGAISIERLVPWQVYVLNSTGSNDYKDAQGFRIPKETNVRGFLKHFGSYFNMQEDWQYLLGASSGSIDMGGRWNSNYDGITDGSNRDASILYGGFGSNMIDIKKVLDTPIQYEYCEWKAITKIRTQMVVTAFGNIIPQVIDANTPPVDGAAISERTQEDTYYAYYLNYGSGATPPKLIKWGKLYMQNIEGFNDEYSGFSIKGNKRDGIPMVKIIEPFWEIINTAFKMFEMLVNDIKPDGWFFNYTSLVKMAAYLQNSKDAPTDGKNGIDDYLKMVQESVNAITDNPETAEGDPMGGGNMAVMPKKNGLNEAAVELMKIMDWVENKIQKYTATEGITPTGGDGFKLSLENKKRARQATTFIDFILLNHLEDISISILNYTQDVAKFPDLPAYKYLASLVGYKCMDFIASMEKAPHRYGTFIDTFNNDIELLEMKQLAMQEYQKGTTPLEDIMIIRSMESIKDALAYMAKKRRENDKKKQADAMGQLKQQDTMAENAFNRQVKLENIKGEWLQKAKAAEATGFANAAAVNANAGITKENIKKDGATQRLADKGNNEIEKLREEANLEAQKPAKI